MKDTEKYLKEHYATATWASMQTHLGMTKAAIIKQASVLGLVRDFKRTKAQEFTIGAPRVIKESIVQCGDAPIRNSNVKGPPYDCPELRFHAARLGALDAYMLPSRSGSRLTHRDGRVEELA